MKDKKIYGLLAGIAFFLNLLLYCTTVQAGYIDNGDGTVTDNGTGLMWQQETAPGTYTWEEAIAYCESLELANYLDWRLPTIKELGALVDKGQFNPAINATFFPNTEASNYWTSTGFGTGSFAWTADFNSGIMSWNISKTAYYYVRAVRSGQAGSFDNLTLWPVPDTGQMQSTTETFGEDSDYSINTPAYTKLDDGCTPLPDNATTWAMVRAAGTGLVWEVKHAMDGMTNYADPNDADNTYTWFDNNSDTNGGDAGLPGDGTDTKDCINALNADSYGGYSDWRMPTPEELHSIVDYGQTPAINTTYFPNTVDSIYGTSATGASNSANSWFVYFTWGTVGDWVKTDGRSVRAVRSGQCSSFADLVISKPSSGAGTVTSSDGRIDCGSHCTEVYIQGAEEVTLTAVPASGSTFTGWSGDCSGTGSCILTMDGAKSVTATFNLIPTTSTTSVVTTTTSVASTTTTSIDNSTTTTSVVITTSSAPSTTTTTADNSTTTTTTTLPDSTTTTTAVQPTTTTAPPDSTTTTTAVQSTTTTTADKPRPCPAQKVLGADDPHIAQLRDFRDSTLASSALGRRIIRVYYDNADSINAALERSPALRAVARRVLKVVAPMVGKR